MCGILALIGTPWRDDAPAALAALAPRGPDDRDLVEHGQALLGHTRLSVIDIAGGHQPMFSPDRRLSIVFNGEIYNFRELRDELETLGYTFRTRSDTEVLLHGYQAWGEELPLRLDGMFAFVVWDAVQRTAFAARDRLGIKPLFYSATQGLAVASTLAPFFRMRGFPRRLDYEALRDYLAFQTVVAPHSILRDVRQLPPASWLRYDADRDTLDRHQYWDIPLPTQTAPTQGELVLRVDAALRRSVARQLVAEVPLGAFLSGGLDSSLVVHYMAEAGARPLKTFSVRFAQGGFDESPHALAVARQYGTEHHVIDAPAIGGEELLGALGALDQPLADPAYVTTAALSRWTKRHVTVALSGDGGDELFGGYARFLDEEGNHPDNALRRLLRVMLAHGLAPSALLRRSLAGQDLLFYRKVELGPWDRSRKSLKAYLAADAWRQCRPDATLDLWRGLIGRFGGRMNTDALMRADLWTYLSGNCLAKTDRASMAHGLEVRVPLLSNEVLDTVLPLPARVHFSGKRGKMLLQQLGKKYLPETVWNRPKHGFSVPLADYFNGQWATVCDDYMARCRDLAPFLDHRAVARLWREARAGHGSRRLAYTFFVLLAWIEQHPLQS
jgi:asparagine synthase (glutamine-hydrolysing)